MAGVQVSLTSTIAGLGTFGYISSVAGLGYTQVYVTSTITGLGTFGYISSIHSLSTGSIFASSIQALQMSTARLMTCTVSLRDQATGLLGNVYQSSALLYFNNFIIGGARVAFGQLL